jgi:hypothetical protein
MSCLNKAVILENEHLLSRNITIQKYYVKFNVCLYQLHRKVNRGKMKAKKITLLMMAVAMLALTVVPVFAN